MYLWIIFSKLKNPRSAYIYILILFLKLNVWEITQWIWKPVVILFCLYHMQRTELIKLTGSGHHIVIGLYEDCFLFIIFLLSQIYTPVHIHTYIHI